MSSVPFWRRAWLYIFLGLILSFLVVPVFIVIPMSFSDSRYLDFPPAAWSFRWYERLFTSIEWYSALFVSLELAAASAVIATPIGVAAAYGLHMSETKIVGFIRSILFLPLMVPHIVLAVGILYLYARLEVLGSFTSLLVAHVMLVIPFVIITASAGLRSFDMSSGNGGPCLWMHPHAGISESDFAANQRQRTLGGLFCIRDFIG